MGATTIGITVLKLPEGPKEEAENRNSTTPIVETIAVNTAKPTATTVFKHPDLIHAPRTRRSTAALSAEETFQSSAERNLPYAPAEFESQPPPEYRPRTGTNAPTPGHDPP